MRTVARVFSRIGCLVLLLLASCPAFADDLGSLDGTWEGTLQVMQVSGTVAKPSPWDVRIVIHDLNVDVFAKLIPGGPFTAVKPGDFRTIRLGPNAIFASLTSGQDDQGRWVETWNFSVTLKTRESLIVSFHRVVNNVDLPRENHDSAFTESDTGVLTRVH